MLFYPSNCRQVLLFSSLTRNRIFFFHKCVTTLKERLQGRFGTSIVCKVEKIALENLVCKVEKIALENSSVFVRRSTFRESFHGFLQKTPINRQISSDIVKKSFEPTKAKCCKLVQQRRENSKLEKL